MKNESSLRLPTLANLANLANYNLQAAKQPAKEQAPDNSLEAMRGSQPKGWGWWLSPRTLPEKS